MCISTWFGRYKAAIDWGIQYLFVLKMRESWGHSSNGLGVSNSFQQFYYIIG